MGMNPIQPLVEFLNIHYRGHDDAMTMVVLAMSRKLYMNQRPMTPIWTDARSLLGDLWSPHRLTVIVVQDMKQGVRLTLDCSTRFRSEWMYIVVIVHEWRDEEGRRRCRCMPPSPWSPCWSIFRCCVISSSRHLWSWHGQTNACDVPTRGVEHAPHLPSFTSYSLESTTTTIPPLLLSLCSCLPS
jgi:hypothetical protein